MSLFIDLCSVDDKKINIQILGFVEVQSQIV